MCSDTLPLAASLAPCSVGAGSGGTSTSEQQQEQDTSAPVATALNPHAPRFTPATTHGQASHSASGPRRSGAAQPARRRTPDNRRHRHSGGPTNGGLNARRPFVPPSVVRCRHGFAVPPHRPCACHGCVSDWYAQQGGWFMPHSQPVGPPWAAPPLGYP